jgi:undecaprenyl-diphosphatase
MTMRSAISISKSATEPASIQAASIADSRGQDFPTNVVHNSSPSATLGGSQIVGLRSHALISAIWAGQFREADMEGVRLLARSARSPIGRLFAVSITKLGNGWVYPILAALIFARWGLSGFRIIVLASVNAAFIHGLYPFIKRRFHRMRPYEVDTKLRSLLAALDQHSFPSGHAMTLTGVFVPIVILWPAMTISAILMACCLAWSRVATAHHYPSDVFAGILLGAGISYPISVFVISFW